MIRFIYSLLFAFVFCLQGCSTSPGKSTNSYEGYNSYYQEFQNCQSQGNNSCMRNADGAFQNNNINHNQ